MLQKQSWQVLSRLDIETIRPVSLSLLRWQFILGEWIDKHIKKSHSSTEKRYLNLTGRLDWKKLKANSLRPGLQSWCGVGLHKLFF